MTESPEIPPPRPPSWTPPYWLLATIAVTTLGADLGSKAWAEKNLVAAAGYPIAKTLTPFLDLILARNRGGAWGLLHDASESVRKPFFFAVSALAIVFIVSLFRRLAPQQRALRWGLPLVLGGALGNLVDRIRYGSVVDFIDFHVRTGTGEHHWPTFNVADIAICIGVGLMALDMLTSRKPAPRAGGAPAESR